MIKSLFFRLNVRGFTSQLDQTLSSCVKEISQRFAEGKTEGRFGFPSGTTVSSHRESWQAGLGNTGQHTISGLVCCGNLALFSELSKWWSDEQVVSKDYTSYQCLHFYLYKLVWSWLFERWLLAQKTSKFRGNISLRRWWIHFAIFQLCGLAGVLLSKVIRNKSTCRNYTYDREFQRNALAVVRFCQVGLIGFYFTYTEWAFSPRNIIHVMFRYASNIYGDLFLCYRIYYSLIAAYDLQQFATNILIQA